MADNEKVRILIVDKDDELCEELARFLTEKDYQVFKADTESEALEVVDSERIDLVLSDMQMSEINGIRLLKTIKKRNFATEVIMMTAYATMEDAITCMRKGASDLIVKPFCLDIIDYAIDRSLKRQKINVKDKAFRESLMRKVRNRTKKLIEKNEAIRDLYLHTIKALAYSLEARDKHTEDHSKRVTSLASELALSMKLSDRDREHIEIASLMHDIGKIGVSEAILTKPGKLTKKEYEKVKVHPVVAEHILSPIKELKSVLKIIRHHHERFDGGGYPDGLKGEEIPLGSRILAICDTYDAMTSNRAYREPFSIEETLKEIKENSGAQFDPEIVKVFLETVNKKKHP